MMGRLERDQGALFHEFHLDDAVPDDRLMRKIAAVLDLSWALWRNDRYGWECF